MKKYIKSTGYKRGGVLREPYIRVSISPKIFVQISFDGKGGAFYAFYYTKNGVRVTNKELSKNLDLLKQYIKRIALTVFYTGIAAAGATAIIGIIINTGGIAAPSLTQAAAALSGMLFNYYTATCFA